MAEGYIPGASTGEGRALKSHETACILNAGDAPAHVEVRVFYSDREPPPLHRVTVPPRRTLHLRFDDLGIPADTDYASVIQADVPRFPPGGARPAQHRGLRPGLSRLRAALVSSFPAGPSKSGRSRARGYGLRPAKGCSDAGRAACDPTARKNGAARTAGERALRRSRGNTRAPRSTQPPPSCRGKA
ncbi:MAG TPA: sensory rhodopsin transducer [Burkholderiales bacterium]